MTKGHCDIEDISNDLYRVRYKYHANINAPVISAIAVKRLNAARREADTRMCDE